MSRQGLIAAISLSTVAAAYGMWGLGVQNDLGGKARLACSSGLVRSHYSGIKAIDKMLCTLVSVLEAASSRRQYELFDAILMSLFVVPIVIVQLESNRAGAPRLLKYSPAVFGLLSQLAGVGLAWPLWAITWLLLNGRVGPSTSSVENLQTIVPGVLIAFLTPVIAQTDPGRRFSRDQRQLLNAAFQVFPITLALLQPVLKFITVGRPRSPADVKRTTINNFIVVNACIYFKAVVDFFNLASQSGSSATKLLESIVKVGLHPKSFPDIAHLFLLFDAASTLFVTFAFVFLAPGHRSGSLTLLASVLALSVVIGPGAALLYGWQMRTSVPEDSVQQKKKN